MALPVSGNPTNFINATATSQTLYGTDGSDQIKTFYGKVGSSESWMYGGLGDDSYITLSSKDHIYENPGEGIDTVKTDWFYELPANVENIILTGTLSVGAKGNSGDNILIGNPGKNILDGAGGADEMTGGAGNDTFVLSGNDKIMDYTDGDLFDLRGLTQYTSFSQVRATMQQVAADVVFNLSATDVVTVKNTTVGQFDASDFVLASDLSNYKLTFDDEFDTLSLNYGTDSDGTWYPLFPRTGLAGHTTPDHGSIQYFTYSGDTGSTGELVGIDPFSVNNGVVTITMNPVPQVDQHLIAGYDYTSGMLNSIGSFSQTYGYFEARVKFAAGTGLHDAFWMLPVDGTGVTEIDVGEARGSDPSGVINVVHAVDSGQAVSHSKQFAVDNSTGSFHTYGVDWEPDYTTFYIDGVAVRSLPTFPGLDKPMYLLASLGGGGLYAGNPDSTTPFPATMQVDYIRAYASPNTVEKGVAVTKVATDAGQTLFGTNLGDTLTGGAGDDKLYGVAGDDTLSDAGGGKDLLDGGFGDDTYIIGSTQTALSEGGNKGTDTVRTTLSNYELPQNFENLVYTGTGSSNGTGNTEDNVITGGDFGNTLSGGDGNDTLQGGAIADLLNGGDGNDTEHGGGGNDTLRGNNSDDLLYGDYGDDVVKGDDGNDRIYGNSGYDKLYGGAGDDVIDGGDGKDQMYGGTGNDIYYVDLASDIVTEFGAEGTDTIYTALSTYVLPDYVENVIYTGSSTFNITGNGSSNRIVGGGGADQMAGLIGDDTYVVNNAGDVVIENADEGTDTVETTLTSYTLGANLENLTYTGVGTASFTGTGNALANVITGGAGMDRLDGKAGADTMIGEAGSDIYVVDNAGDVVVEAVGAGNDRVISQVSYTLSDNVETLQLSTGKALDGTGNAIANTLIGNAGANALDGRGGADTLTGGAGNDSFVFQRGEADEDTVTDFAGAGLIGGDVLKFVGYGAGAYLTHQAGTDLYVIHAGADYGGATETVRLAGVTSLGLGDYLIDGVPGPRPGDGPPLPNDHSGDDTYIVTSPSDTVSEQPNSGYDTVQTTLASYKLPDNVEALVFVGTGKFTGTGNALDNMIQGDGSADRLDGGAGADTLKGGASSDTYIVDNVGDVVVELAGQGTDRVLASVTYTLSDNVENLTLTTSKAINGTGNALANLIIGNGAANTLDGAGGVDKLTGGTGNDLFVFHQGEGNGDTVTDFAGAGAPGGDVLQFVGYGAGTLTQVGTSDSWIVQADAAHGGLAETIHLTGVTTLGQGDYLFL